ncbi:hypothetical protein LDO26_13765 [Luteimonas sp. BDR2-5]|uniref:hypothetical protein n=1 Tax=Proluteimonas luteida TaxID=2878685 RepID=UPI001E57E8E2|nr:hypothetical protein [Luteimonas sp. BDR2-5]MCD9029265.1 hypothetical protein [Luteimonas sp. BDR2-5]
MRRKLSSRRLALFATVALLLCGVAWMHHAGVAGVSGMPFEDMDWNEDGEVTRGEVLQAFHAVVVTRSASGSRECTEYRWRRDASVIRVDCRTVLAPDQD